VAELADAPDLGHSSGADLTTWPLVWILSRVTDFKGKTALPLFTAFPFFSALSDAFCYKIATLVLTLRRLLNLLLE
jgi:hypothetical protein